MNAIRRLSRKTKNGGTTEPETSEELTTDTKSAQQEDMNKATNDDVYGYGDPAESAPTVDYGYGDDTTDYGYGDSSGDGGVDYGYGDEHPSTNMTAPQSPSRSPKQRTRQRSVRRNSTVIRKDDNNPLAVAEYLMGGPPLMSDRDLETSVNPAA